MFNAKNQNYVRTVMLLSLQVSRITNTLNTVAIETDAIKQQAAELFPGTEKLISATTEDNRQTD